MKILKHIVIYSFFILISCGPEASCEIYNYTVRNESGTDIKITGYNTANNKLQSFFVELKNNEGLTKSYENCPPGEIPYYSFNNFFESDSIKIIFSTNKKIFYKKVIICENNNDDSKRNLLNECLYNSNRNKTESFIFTVQDYENAIDCNRNCE
ncbi:hypothetical protein [Polaribacter sp. M15]